MTSLKMISVTLQWCMSSPKHEDNVTQLIVLYTVLIVVELTIVCNGNTQLTSLYMVYTKCNGCLIHIPLHVMVQQQIQCNSNGMSITIPLHNVKTITCNGFQGRLMVCNGFFYQCTGWMYQAVTTPSYLPVIAYITSSFLV